MWGERIPAASSTSYIFYPLHPDSIDEETRNLYAVHLEIRDVPHDNGCGHHVIASYLNWKSVPLLTRFTEEGMKNMNFFDKLKMQLQLTEREQCAKSRQMNKHLFLPLVRDCIKYYCFLI